jgi:hypothetical protein
MPAAKLNWAAAEVEDATLIVALEGDLPSGWKKGFESTVRLLGSGEWGKVQIKKRTVVVKDVSPGGEEKLRHFLESVVEQANASHPPAESESDAGDEDAAAAGDDDGADALMAKRFRSFAGADADADADA